MYNYTDHSPEVCKLDNEHCIHYRSFADVEALDAYDLTVINFQDENIWRNQNSSCDFVDCRRDINSIAEAIHQSRKCNILILFPENYTFKYNWGSSDWGTPETYLSSHPLKDMKRNVTDSIVKPFTPTPLSVVFGRSETLIGNHAYISDFSFDHEKMSFLSIHLKSTAGTTTGIQLNNQIYATTLKINSPDDLIAISEAMGILAPKSAELPKWLDDIPYLNEDSLKKELLDIREKMQILQTRQEEIEDNLAENRHNKAILCTKDTDLEKRVVSILAALFEVSNDFVDEKEEDFRFTTDSHIFAFEVKGSLKGIQGQHVSKTFNHMQIIQDSLDDTDSREVKGVLILATEIEKLPSERQALHPRQVAIAERNNIGIMSTEALLRLYEAKQEGRVDKDKLLELFAVATGEIDVSSVILPRK